jgi:RNA polymerase sigma factor (sigma-70 family)
LRHFRPAESQPMTDVSFATTWLHQQIERLRMGDRAAQEALVQATGARLRRIAHRMLQGYPGVRIAADTDDVLQNTLIRLLAALRTIRPESTRDFFQLAAFLTRQELIDLLRRCSRREADALPAAVAAPEQTPDQLDAWLHFHQAVARLPADVREVVSLKFYHGWPQSQIAEVMGVDVRTVRRHWAVGCLRLREALQDDMDALFGPS